MVIKKGNEIEIRKQRMIITKKKKIQDKSLIFMIALESKF